MTTLTFNQSGDKYICYTQGFTGVMQVTKADSSRFEVYAKLHGFDNEQRIYTEYGAIVIACIDIPTEVDLEIVSFSPVIEAGYIEQ